MKQNIKNNPKIMKAWAFYDWANSVYSLVITSTIFPIYYSIITTAYEKSEYVTETGKWIKVPVRNMINIFGKDYQPDAVYGYSLTISFLIVVILSPILSSLADTIGNKKSFFQGFSLFSYQCSLLLFSTACIFYHVSKSLSTTFLFFFVVVLSRQL
jgi:UMF1 family MFS transporter